MIPPQPPAQPVQAQHIHVQGALPNGQFPPQLQQAFAHFHAVNQQIAAQLAAAGNSPGIQGIGPNNGQAQMFQQPHFAPPSFQQVVPQQQQPQARTVGEQPGSGAIPQHLTQPSYIATPGTQGNILGLSHSQPPENPNPTVRENRGPNGERSQIRAPSGQTDVNPSHGLANPPATQGSLLAPSVPRLLSPAAQGNISPQPLMLSMALAQLQSNLSMMETAMAGGNPLPETVFEQAREMLRGIADLPQEERSNISTRVDGLANRANHLRETLNNYLSRAAYERAAAQRIDQGVQSSAVYILSSPSGPHALLVSPNGNYSAPWQLPGLGFASPHSLIHHHSHNAAGLQQPINSVPQAQQPAPQQVHGTQVNQVQQQQQHQQQQQQPQVNQARDLLRVLLPLGGHLWLIIRLFGFVYFFTAGAGWRRTVLLGLVASLVFLAQTGIFRPVIQSIWDPIRRHAEGLVPLAGNDGPAVGAGEAGGNVDTPGTQAAIRDPTPQEAAERLLQERERQDVNFMRQTIRRIERAIALFVASLVPGVGERHIAARVAAEAARQAESRQREEEARREEEEARQRQEGENSEDASTGGNANVAGDGAHEATVSRQSEQAAPPPTVEV